MRTIALTAAVTVALLLGVAAGWTWQQWQPVPGHPSIAVEATE